MNLTRIDSHNLHGLEHILLPLLLAALIASSAVAQSNGSLVPDTLTLDRCIAIARGNSPELRIAANAIEAARFDRKLIAKSLLPQVKFVGDAGYAPISLGFGYDPAVSNGGEFGARVLAEQTLYSGGLHSLQMKAAGTEIGRGSVAWQQEDRDLVYAVRLAFIELLRSEQTLAHLQKSVSRLSDYADLVNRLKEAGTVGYTDYLKTQVELTRAEIEVSAARGVAESASLNLARVVGEPDDTTLLVGGALDNLLVDTGDTVVNIRTLQTSDNLDLSAARLKYTKSQLALSMTKAQWKPKASLSLDAGVVTSRENLLLQPGDRYNSVGYSVGVNVEMPLWNWGVRKTDVAKGQLEVKSAQDNIDMLQRDIVAAYSDTRSRFHNENDRLKSIRFALQTAEKVYLFSVAQYSDGVSSAYEVLTAQQTLTDVRRTEIDALAEIQSLQAQLERITTSAEDGKQ